MLQLLNLARILIKSGKRELVAAYLTGTTHDQRIIIELRDNDERHELPMEEVRPACKQLIDDLEQLLIVRGLAWSRKLEDDLIAAGADIESLRSARRTNDVIGELWQRLQADRETLKVPPTSKGRKLLRSPGRAVDDESDAKLIEDELVAYVRRHSGTDWKNDEDRWSRWAVARVITVYLVSRLRTQRAISRESDVTVDIRATKPDSVGRGQPTTGKHVVVTGCGPQWLHVEFADLDRSMHETARAYVEVAAKAIRQYLAARAPALDAAFDDWWSFLSLQQAMANTTNKWVSLRTEKEKVGDKCRRIERRLQTTMEIGLDEASQTFALALTMMQSKPSGAEEGQLAGKLVARVLTAFDRAWSRGDSCKISRWLRVLSPVWPDAPKTIAERALGPSPSRRAWAVPMGDALGILCQGGPIAVLTGTGGAAVALVSPRLGLTGIWRRCSEEKTEGTWEFEKWCEAEPAAVVNDLNLPLIPFCRPKGCAVGLFSATDIAKAQSALFANQFETIAGEMSANELIDWTAAIRPEVGKAVARLLRRLPHLARPAVGGGYTFGSALWQALAGSCPNELMACMETDIGTSDERRAVSEDLKAWTDLLSQFADNS